MIKNQISQQGFSLVEILIAMLVFSVGVGGYFALQIKSVTIGNDAHLRAQAARIADNFIGRVDALDNSVLNTQLVPTTVTDGLGNTSIVTQSVTSIVPRARDLYFVSASAEWADTSAVATYPVYCHDDTQAASCDTQIEQAVSDIQQTKFLVQNNLPNGEITLVDCQDGPNDLCIVISWGNTAMADCTGANVDSNDSCYFRKASF